MNNDTVTIILDGKTCTARKGQMLIEISDQHDIYIPRFCYHEKLSVVANCRMCLVEVEKVSKPLPACATPVMEGMVVKTKSPLAMEAQRSVMEFLLINHPLDCPICDQGGECELQDLSVGYGYAASRYQEQKRVVHDKDIGPLIQTDMTRCIHCTRCVRFGEEIAGLRELGATGRGEHTEIGTYIEKAMHSEMAGNIIDLCPVGALTSKPFRFSARAWELEQKPAIAAHDSTGSHLYAHVKDNRIKRVVPRENQSINENWLSDRDRFAYEGLYDSERLLTPQIKEDGVWKDLDWELALSYTREKLQLTLDRHGGEQIGALAAPTLTLEELYLFQKLMRQLDCRHIDHRLRQRDFSDQAIAPHFPHLGLQIEEIERLDTVLLVGSYARKEQPLVNHHLRKMVGRGGRVMVINPVDYHFNYALERKCIVPPDRMAQELLAIIKHFTAAEEDAVLRDLVQTVEATSEHMGMANALRRGKALILLGNTAVAHPGFSLLRGLAIQLARLSDARLGYLGESANTTGAWLAGVLPHRLAGGQPSPQIGLDAYAMLAQPRKAYVLMGFEPELDCWSGALAKQSLQDATLVIALNAYCSEAMKAYADILLPIVPFSETAGTYINNEGLWQTFSAMTKPLGEAKPGWKVLRVLAEQFSFPGFDYSESDEILDEIDGLMVERTVDTRAQWKIETVEPVTAVSPFQRMMDIPIYSIDSITRRATGLQRTGDIADGALHIHPDSARQLDLNNADLAEVEQDGRQIAMPVLFDQRVPRRCVLIHGAQIQHAQLGGAFGEIQITKPKGQSNG